MNGDICFSLQWLVNAGEEANLTLVQPCIVEVCLEQTQGAVPEAVKGKGNTWVLYGNIIFEPESLQLIQWPVRRNIFKKSITKSLK